LSSNVTRPPKRAMIVEFAAVEKLKKDSPPVTSNVGANDELLIMPAPLNVRTLGPVVKI
jgi:hypothetical protein